MSSLIQQDFFSQVQIKHRQTDLPRLFIENNMVRGPAQAMLPALEAILGQRSAHSLATGPVMADPEEQVSRVHYHSMKEQQSFTKD